MNIVPSNPKKSPKITIRDSGIFQVSCFLILFSYLSSQDDFFDIEYLDKLAPWVFGILGASGLIGILFKFYPEIVEPPGMIRMEEKTEERDKE